MGFFDFAADLDRYRGSASDIARLNRRHDFIIAPFEDEIRGSRVLDLAAHDGRWSYAFAAAGAEAVDGVEARPELIAQFAAYPETDFKTRVTLTQADIFDHLDQLVSQRATYDVVAVFGILYHVMDHHRLLLQIRRLEPKLVIVDSEFMMAGWPMVALVREGTRGILNAAPYYEGQRQVVKGTPSSAAMEVMADTLGFALVWSPWESLPTEDRRSVPDYFRAEKMRRRTCTLRLRPEAGGSGSASELGMHHR